jgi:hypothetical protein
MATIERMQKEAAKRESESNKELWAKYDSEQATAPQVVDAISLDKQVYETAKKIADFRGESLNEYFARAVSGLVELDLQQPASELYGLPKQIEHRPRAAEGVKKCAMCGSTDLSTATVTYRDDSKEEVPVCSSCGHYHFKDAEYAYVIRGLAKNWASVSDLKGTLEDILGDFLQPVDRRGLVVEVAEYADYKEQ